MFVDRGGELYEYNGLDSDSSAYKFSAITLQCNKGRLNDF